MFSGEYSVQLGEKNRVAMPKKLRVNVNGSLYITRGFDESLLLIDEKTWKTFEEKISSHGLFMIDSIDFRRYVVGGLHELTLDKQGRFVVPEGLKNFARLHDEVVFIGVSNWIELWEKERWENKIEKLNTTITQIGENLEYEKR